MIAPFTSACLGSRLQDPGGLAEPADPFMLEINRTDWREWWRVDSLHINGTLGQPMSCDFTLRTPTTPPKAGDVVRVLYYAEVLFSGIITRCEPQPNPALTVIFYQCECTDWSILLTRRKLRRNFTNLPVANIVDSILDNELAGDGLSIGTIDQGATIPLVDVKNAKAFDVLRDVAGATGQAMYVDFDKRIQFRTTSNDLAPKVIDYTTVEASSLVEDLETYRNVQTVIVTGTPPQGVEANVATVTRTNDDQIAARIAIEGGTGRYDDIEEVTHPTSNAGADLALMAIGYARLRLATSGTPRKTLKVTVRGYGFREGQFATVDLPAVGASGTWLIQRVSFIEQAAKYLRYDIELTQSSSQQRAYEAWLSIVKAGKIVVQLPGSITSNQQTFNTPGTTTWTSPITGTVEFTCYGPGGGGAGAFPGYSGITGCAWVGADGGTGGPGGKSISIVSVVVGQVFDITVGSAGLAGVTGAYFNPFIGARCFGYPTDPTAGATGSASKVLLAGSTKCQGDAGQGGALSSGVGVGITGSSGSGIGDAVTVGGGKPGGIGGISAAAAQGGQDGLVEVRW